MNKSVAFKLTGAAALAGSSQAYGQIVVITPPDNLTNPGTGSGVYTFQNEYYNVLMGQTDSSGTSADDFQFAYFISHGADPLSQAYVTGYNPSSVVASALVYVPTAQQSYLYADALSLGAKIPGNLQFNNQAGSPGTIYLTSVASDGTVVTPGNYQQPNTIEYLGFQFLDSNDSKLHNGWIELESVTYPNGDLSGVNFLGAAYNSVPADALYGAGDITAGEVPEPGTISSLMLGAAALVGVGLMRRRRAGLASE